MKNNFTESDFDIMRRCAKRELGKRKNFYPKWVQAGKMSQKEADFEIEGMNLICDYFDWLQIHNPSNQQKLF